MKIAYWFSTKQKKHNKMGKNLSTFKLHECRKKEQVTFYRYSSMSNENTMSIKALDAFRFQITKTEMYIF